MTTKEQLPFGELGDLSIKSHDEGPDAVRGALLQVLAIEKELPEQLQAQLRHTPGGVWGVFSLVCAAMVNPDAGMKELLGWTEPLVSLHVLQNEQERLRAAGVRSDAALTSLAKAAAVQQQTTKDRMLRVVHEGKATA